MFRFQDKEHIHNRYIELFLDSVPEYKSDYGRQGGVGGGPGPGPGPGMRPNVMRPRGGAPFGGPRGDRVRGGGFGGNPARGQGLSIQYYINIFSIHHQLQSNFLQFTTLIKEIILTYDF